MKNKDGFSLVETMVSMSLVLLGLLMSSRILMYSWHHQGGVMLRFKTGEALAERKNALIALPFASPSMQVGAHELEEDSIRFEWFVEETGPGMKEIKISASRGAYRIETLLIRSIYIEEVNRHEGNHSD